MLVLIYIYVYINSTNIPPIMTINRIYEHQNLLSLWLVSFLVGLRTFQHPCITETHVVVPGPGMTNLWHAAVTAVPISSYFFCPTTVSILWSIYVYIHTHIWHRTDCIRITVATKQHGSETFLHKSERCEVLTGYLSLGHRSGGDWANTWHWTERFTVFFWNRK